MHRAASTRLSPFIEALILGYGSAEGGSSSNGRLRAHVTGVGHMSQSQALESRGPMGLLFLSDGVLQIPAILTMPAWEQLQEQEERECFSSLLNTTVHIQDYQLQFHMALEQTKCRFFLSIGELATTAAGPVRGNTPCCTTLPSVRRKICQTWRGLMGRGIQESQMSQCGFELSELLGEWKHDCLQDVLEDIRERLAMAHPTDPQPSTSSSTTSPLHNLHTTFDVDRLRFKGEKCFSVPRCLLMPEEDAQQLQTPTSHGGGTQCGVSSALENRKKDLPQRCKSTQPPLDDVEWKISRPALVHPVCEANETSPDHEQDAMLHENIVAGMFDSNIRPLANPWDIFPPPCETSSSSSRISPELTSMETLPKPTAGVSGPAHDTHLLHQEEESRPSWEQSCLKPYQNPPPSADLLQTDVYSSTPEPFIALTNLGTSTDQHCNSTAQPKLPATDQDGQILEDDEGTVMRKSKNAKRKRHESTPEAPGTEVQDEGEETQISTSPPSWLFDTQGGSGPEEGDSQEQRQTVGIVQRKTPNTHSDGSKFSYAYKVSRQNLQDFSRFKVTKHMLNWALKYILDPQQRESPRDSSGTSNQTTADRSDVITL